MLVRFHPIRRSLESIKDRFASGPIVQPLATRIENYPPDRHLRLSFNVNFLPGPTSLSLGVPFSVLFSLPTFPRSPLSYHLPALVLHGRRHGPSLSR
jgi:hypothetical protein